MKPQGPVALASDEVGWRSPRSDREARKEPSSCVAFPALVILQCVRWYSKYTISYRQLKEMMAERGIVVDHTTVWRWIQRYAPQLEKDSRVPV